MTPSRGLRLVGAFLLAAAVERTAVIGQSEVERFWLAGHYDATRVIVYFEAVHFNTTFPADAGRIARPIADGFFDPAVLTAGAISRFQQDPKAERFAVGDRYDLLLDGGRVASLSLTALVGFESDEFVGNDSYIGALGQVSSDDLPLLTTDHYVVRRHVALSAPRGATMTQRPNSARLLRLSVAPSTRAEMLPLLGERLPNPAGATTRPPSGHAAVSIKRVQAFMTADGDLRYFVVAEAGVGKACTTTRAWLAPAPALHIVAADDTGYCAGTLAEGTRLLNIVDLGDRRTGMVVLLRGGDGMALELVQYQDGADLSHMRMWHSISFGE